MILSVRGGEIGAYNRTPQKALYRGRGSIAEIQHLSV